MRKSEMDMKAGIKALTLGLAMLSFGAAAQNFPTKPIRVVLPYPAGGTTDMFVRTLSQKLQESTGQPWVIEYRPGAATMIAAASAKTAAPDGYTVLVGTTSMAINPLMYRKVDYRMEDFTPISTFATGPLAMSVSKKVPANNAKEFIEYVRANPGKVNYATLGAGGMPHLLAIMLEQQGNVKMTDVPYKGAGPALTALVAGDVQLYFDSVPSSLAQMRAGNIRILGVGAEERLKGIPDLPTLREQGINITSSAWFGFLVPAATPKPIVAQLHREIVKAVSSQDYQTRVIDAGQAPTASPTPEDFQRFIERDTAAWAKVIKPLNLQLD